MTVLIDSRAGGLTKTTAAIDLVRLEALAAAVTTVVVPAPAAPPAVEEAADAGEMPEVLARAKAGDRAAWAELFERHQDSLMRFVYYRTGNRQLTEDLVQDVWVRALRNLSGSFVWRGTDVGAWLITVARNLVADYFKSGRYRYEVTFGMVPGAPNAGLPPGSGCADKPAPDRFDPELAVCEYLQHRALLSALLELGDRNVEQYECLVLRYLQGFSVAETAQSMGKNEGAIKALTYRAVRALARLLPDGLGPVAA